MRQIQRALIIGYGSIGRRYKELLLKRNFAVYIVSRHSDQNETTFNTLDTAFLRHNFDFVVVATETSEHYAVVTKLIDLQYAGRVLIEKPIFEQVYPLAEHEHTFASLGVAYNLRFHPIIQKARELCENEQVVFASAYVGQNLQAWRPGRDYSKTYSALKEKGGGVLRDLSHEIDYLLWILGKPKMLTARGGTWGNLQMTAEDTYSIILELERCPCVTISMNCIDLCSSRTLRIVTTKNSFYADFINGTIQLNDQLLTVPTERNLTFNEQIGALLNDDFTVLSSAQEALEVVRVIECAEQAAKNKAWLSC